MNSEILLGHKVHHKSWGAGRIYKTEDKYVWVDFETDGEKKFQFPKAFASFLTLDDDALQAELLEENERISEVEKAEKKLAEAATKVKPITQISAPRSEHTAANNGVAFNGHILEIGNTFNTHAEVFNKCFGYNYKHYQMAYKNIGNGYAVWFPSIAKQGIHGLVPTDTYTGWKNSLHDDNKKLIQYDKEKNTGNKDPDLNKRLVFAKFDNGQGYKLIGVYGSEKRVEGGFEYTRLGTKFDIDSFQIIDKE